MKRRLFGLSILGFLGAAGAWAQLSEEADIVVVPVVQGVHMFMAAGGNIGVLSGADGTILIDDQYAPMVPRIKKAAVKLSESPIRMILNTHWHGDHTGGNELFGKEGAVIIAHDNVRRRMSSSHFSKFFDREIPASPAAALPVITFAEDLTLHLNGHTVRVEHVPPAHTDGDSIVWLPEAKVAHLGDNFFNGLYPFIDLDSGGSVRGMLRAAESVYGRIDNSYKVIPGHGPLSDKEGLGQFIAMLRASIERVDALIADGNTLDEIIAAKPLADFDADWGNNFIKADSWLSLVHRGLSDDQ